MRAYAVARAEVAAARLTACGADPDRWMATIAAAPITLSFHPDRLDGQGRTVAQGLLADGVYRPQFVTGISNGGLASHPADPRWRWEERLFGDAYRDEDPATRPVYGALHLGRHPAGGAPRFGSCALVLRPELFARATLSVGDSYSEPEDLGTREALLCIAAGLAERVGRETPLLDDYVEAQIHGGVRLPDDVEAVLIDPSYRGTEVAEGLARLGPLRWHGGFSLAPAAVPASFRGPEIAQLGQDIARRFGLARLDPAALGRASQQAARCPEDWAAYGGSAEVQQALKRLWHALAQFGLQDGSSSEAGLR